MFSVDATYRTVFLLLLLSCFYVCNAQVTKRSDTRDSTPYYFPLEKFRDTSIFVGYNTFVVKWYSKHLYALKEPVLFNIQSDNEMYRFVWLRTFHSPIVIRIEKNRDSYKLFWKQSDGAGGYGAGQIIVDKQLTIDKKTWDAFLGKLNEIDFWKLPTNKTNFGHDGSRWILEAKTPEKYHVVDRWTPNNNDKFYQTCDFLIGLTDLRIQRRDKY